LKKARDDVSLLEGVVAELEAGAQIMGEETAQVEVATKRAQELLAALDA